MGPASTMNLPGSAVKPVSLVAPVFGLNQWAVPASFSLPPAILSPPQNVINVVHSASVGICQPVGAIFRLSITEYQLYNIPSYFTPNVNGPIYAPLFVPSVPFRSGCPLLNLV